jgi:hypothetical protein
VAKRYQRVPELILGFDTETTGLSVSSERAISYGFSAYRFGVPVWSEQFFVIPDRPISPGAKRVHGLSVEDMEAKRGSEKVYSVERVMRAVQILRTSTNKVRTWSDRTSFDSTWRCCVAAACQCWVWNSTTLTSTSHCYGSSTSSITISR